MGLSQWIETSAEVLSTVSPSLQGIDGSIENLARIAAILLQANQYGYLSNRDTRGKLLAILDTII
jgi:hypothetical protein